ncbi:ABC transporter permease [Pseudactinotalea suaedae]|uniref:ABC transporter permease n=1 Tax=Pseudactinotalea suaedae TaxID=1524924 RepID=UPI0012E208AF|nr:ABC transporter permease [Pseudactinotalea suaedae]
MTQTLISRGTAAVFRTETRLFGRELGSLFWIVAFPVVLVCVLGFVPTFRDVDPDLGGLRVIDIYVPIGILLSMIMASIMAMPPVVFGYREAGVLRRLQTTPVRPLTLLGAQVVLHGAAVAASTVLLLVVGRLLFQTPLPQAPGWYALAYLLALLATFGLGAIVTAVAPNARVGTAIGMVVFFPSMFTAGVWFPVQGMGGLLQQIVELTPLGAASQALYQAMAGGVPDLAHLLVMVGWVIITFGVASRTFRWQ